MRLRYCSSSRFTSLRDLPCTSTAGRSSRPGTSSRICDVRSRAESRLMLAALVLTALLAAAPLPAAPPPAGRVPSDEQIVAAAKALRTDPNLGGERKERTLRWVDEKQPQAGHSPAWLEWIRGLF